MPIVLPTLRRTAALAAAAACLILAAQPASAALIRVDFQALVTHTQRLPIVGIAPALGDTVVGHFIYDTAAIDEDPGDPTNGLYTSGSIQIEIGGLTLSSVAPARQVAYDSNMLNDLWSTRSGWTGQDNDDGVLVNGVFTPRVRIGMGFRAPLGTLISDAQPGLAELGLMEVSRFYLIQDDPDSNIFDRIVLFDDVTMLEAAVVPVAVPVPATLPLVLTGLAAAIGRRRRGR